MSPTACPNALAIPPPLALLSLLIEVTGGRLLSLAASANRPLAAILHLLFDSIKSFRKPPEWLLLGPPLPVDATLRTRRLESVVPWLTGGYQHCSNQKSLCASYALFNSSLCRCSFPGALAL
ncbi:BQ5605_C009g05472 [Microbotryum silenes-dioicae]|uniref:BQ5605_C009g05472 protein n=1 Tax=Microbotryum silenes-dioicae TaxID=796604 RepID=A0A2X0MHW4_9BASI|nr:BQ5605_C009g05472 [Microbotryum silenes-dioicae]